MLDRAEQHATGTAGWVVDALAFLRIEDLDHHADNAARGVELAGLVAACHIGELADQILVGVTEHVRADCLVAKRNRGKSLNQVLEQLVGELLPVAPISSAENAIKGVRVRALDTPASRPKQRSSDVRCGLSDVLPVATFRKVSGAPPETRWIGTSP